MSEWYYIYTVGKARQREIEEACSRSYLVGYERKKRNPLIKKMIKKQLHHLGRRLETLGRVLQKRYQTC